MEMEKYILSLWAKHLRTDEERARVLTQMLNEFPFGTKIVTDYLSDWTTDDIMSLISDEELGKWLNDNGYEKNKYERQWETM